MTRVAVIGGGPGGLLAASLIAERRRDIEVELIERNGPDESFGFGVVFSSAKLARLAAADERLGAELSDNSRQWDQIELRLNQERIRCTGLGFSAIARRRLLDLLRKRAEQAGVRPRFRTEADPAALERSHDLVIAADGVNSRVRELHAESFRPTIDAATARYIWFGADRPFESMTFLFERTEAGWFAVHAYPFDQHTSTFVVECDERTWRRAGLDAAGALPPGANDEHSRRAMQEVFAGHLDGARLLANNSRWAAFRTVRTARWCHDRTVLLGDAAHTAHFSVGSGTTMALDDALTLARVVSEAPEGGMADALRSYEDTRRPQVASVQDAATPSLSWWEHFGQYARLAPRQFATHFLTRSGRVSFHRLAQGDPAFGADTLRWFGAPDAEAVLRTPGPASFPGRLVTREDIRRRCPAARWLTAPADPSEVTRVVSELSAEVSAAGRPPLVVIDGRGHGQAPRTAAVLLAELVRLELGIAVALLLDRLDTEWLTTYILSGRADLLVLPDPGGTTG
ncbi:FAD-dependent monooxygenase [Pseudonocardia acaciae]|uniref:FAD-dependent monooxygenase n=1 Tax=Pseudonocardia acaciae TaxID=551276 RepID=UPI00048C3953|nr:FAD-dependent monooxygenase [Pseudonocardia acaciae]